MFDQKYGMYLWMDWIKEQQNTGRVAQVIAACIRTYEANADRMRYDFCRKLGLPSATAPSDAA